MNSGGLQLRLPGSRVLGGGGGANKDPNVETSVNCKHQLSC